MRDQIQYDVAIIGAGPAGLSTAISIKQRNPDISIAILEKGAEVGSHIISGAILDTVSLSKLLPDWHKDADCPIKVKVKKDKYFFLTKRAYFELPNIFKPKILSNKNCYVISLGKLTKYLAGKAEAMGVEIFAGFCAKELVYGKNNEVTGIIIGDFGINKDGSQSDNYTPGPEIFCKYLVISEGARGSLAKQIINKYNLDKESHPQQYALGIKEIWEIDNTLHSKGKIEHFIGYPLNKRSPGGGFIYHNEDNKISIGFITHLDYTNPKTSPYKIFNEFKAHPYVKALLSNGKRIRYGARAISSGGYYSIPKLSFPGGVLVGCSAGMVNSARIKGIHNAISSGISAAKYITKALAQERSNDTITEFAENWKYSDFGKDLYMSRNFKYLWRKLGIISAILSIYLKANIFRGKSKQDFKALKPVDLNDVNDVKKQHESINDSLIYANIHHNENQPCHLIIKDHNVQLNSELHEYAGPSMYYCPAAVYKWEKTNDGYVYNINAQNCVHCKTCDIKDPNQNINWTCPEGGSGPNYIDM